MRDLNTFSGHCGRIDYFFDKKSEDGEVFVFLHGLGASHAQFSFMWKKSGMREKSGFSQSHLVVDFPGHGDNIWDGKFPINFENFSELVIALCDELEIKNAIFVGISMGSALALLCAFKRADLVKELVLIRPSWLDGAAPSHLSLIDRCGKWLQEVSVEETLVNLQSDTSYIEMLEDVPLAAASVKGVIERLHAAEHAPVLCAMFNSAPFSASSILRNIDSPAIVVGNHADDLHPISIAKATANALPNAALDILPPRYLQPDQHQAALASLINQKIGVHA